MSDFVRAGGAMRDEGTEASFRDMLTAICLTPEQQHGSVIHGGALEVMATMERQSVDLIVADPPYYKVKGREHAWDWQWKTAADYLTWIGSLCQQWARILKPNGSLYVFASPDMAARVECVVREHLQVINRIRWVKEAGWHQKTKKEELRAFLTPWEEIIFAEPFWSDTDANEQAGYESACSALHKKVYAPIGCYIQQERERAAFTQNQVDIGMGRVEKNHPEKGTRLIQRWEEGSSLPTKEDYERLRCLLNGTGNEYLRKEYEDLRKEYEDLRRPFFLSAKVPFTDVWDFPTVASSPYKHICEKSLSLLSHIITCSSRPGALVLDTFCGSGSTGVAAIRNGRRFIGIEQDALWVSRANEWIAAEQKQDVLPLQPKPPVTAAVQTWLFAEEESDHA